MVATNGLSRRRQAPDYYSILGVARNATYGEIRDAYWKRAFKIDRRDLEELNEAYEILGDDRRRRAYNNERNADDLS